MDKKTTDGNIDIAVIGLSCNFPSAKTPEAYWNLLINAEESVKHFSNKELRDRGVKPELIADKNFVPATSSIDDYELFDANFFSCNPREATYMDPQHRIFLECCWSVFEDAGYIPDEKDKVVGVFAGLGMNTYISEVMMKNKSYLNSITSQEIMLGNDKDFLTSLVSYKLNLTGPCVNVNAACSTSLVAIHLARQSLLLHECDMAVAGAVSILLSNRNGYMYIRDSILSPDGHCRPFDVESKGTLWGDGCGVVLLKRLIDALEDNDHIYAVIKGSAINNDGAEKAGFTAPSVDGQVDVIAQALADAGLEAQDINFVEAHGTGTILGDPIEIEALTQAFSLDGQHIGSCPVGSVKSNLGHLNAAAGMAGIIKSILALQHRQLPPSLNFQAPNPSINFSSSPFFVNTKVLTFDQNKAPLRAAVNSLGLGGTNAHIILEEFPQVARSIAVPSSKEVLIVSAATTEALHENCKQLATFLEHHDDVVLADVAFTLATGRKAFEHRKALICENLKQAVSALCAIARDSLATEEIFPNEHYKDERLQLASAWLRGENIDWHDYYQREAHQRIALPTYTFQKQRYWVEPEEVNSTDDHSFYYTKLDNMANWFYVPSWSYIPLPFSETPEVSQCWLIFSDDSNLSIELIDALLRQTGNALVTVRVGENYKRRDDHSFVLNPLNRDHFQQLTEYLASAGLLPDSILFLWSLEEGGFDSKAGSREPVGVEEACFMQQCGLPGILHLTQTLVPKVAEKTVNFYALTNNTFDVTGNENMSVLHSTVYGISMVIQQEYSNFTCRVLDIDINTPKSFDKFLAEAILREIFSSEKHLVTAFRGEKRYLRKYQPLRIEEQAPQYNGVYEDGLYLNYSGLEGIGFLISESIVKQKGARLLLLEEDGMPEPDEWDSYLARNSTQDPISMRIQNAKDLLKYESVTYIGTLSQLVENQNRIEDIQREFGNINGLIHSPGASNYRRIKSIKDLNYETWREQFNKVAWSLVKLDHIFQQQQLDFRVMLNSLGSVIGGPGFTSIASASTFAKTFATYNRRQGKPLWAIQCWDSWIIEWEQAKNNLPTKMFERIFPSVLTHEEGLKAFYRLFSSKDIVETEISATSLTMRYRKWVELESRRTPNFSESTIHQDRPKMNVDYRHLENDLQKTLGSMYSDLLGIKHVGLDDNFFDLGGSSLLAIQLATKLRECFAIDIDLFRLMELPTLEELSRFVQQALEEEKGELKEVRAEVGG